MKLPNHADAVVPAAKITSYLLSTEHRDGRGKALFFLRFGYSIVDWPVMAEALRKHAADHEVALTEQTPFGIRYVIEGEVLAPDGRIPSIRAVWFIETGDDMPRFVTAYPLARGK